MVLNIDIIHFFWRNRTSYFIEIKQYRGIIGSLLYLTASRPDITFAVGVCARYQASPRESHLEAAKKILQYLKGTIEIGLWYPCDDNFVLLCRSTMPDEPEVLITAEQMRRIMRRHPDLLDEINRQILPRPPVDPTKFATGGLIKGPHDA